MWKRLSHPKNTTVHNRLDARRYKGCIVVSSSLTLTTTDYEKNILVFLVDMELSRNSLDEN